MNDNAIVLKKSAAAEKNSVTLEIAPQVGEQIAQQSVEQKGNTITPQLVEQIRNDIFSIGWGHHRFIIDKFKDQPQKALFFVHQTVENGWSRDMLLNFMGTDLYERDATRDR